MIRALVLTRYGYQVASSRQRFLQYINYLRSAEIDCTIQTFFWDEYLTQRFEGIKTYRFFRQLMAAYINRAKVLRSAKDYDLLLVQTEIFPYLPATVEKAFLSLNIPHVYDFDDAWFHRYEEHQNVLVRKLLGNKISYLMHRASAVIVGSTYLYTYAKRYQNKVILLPTTINLERYPTMSPIMESNKPFTIGWIGSPSTAPYLKEILKVLKEFCSRHNARIVIIGAGLKFVDIPNVTYVEWNEDSEVAEISKFDVGLMPLPDTPFARGKCAFKLIQYMGCWKPVIASPVGENIGVIEHGINGFLADTEEQWYDALMEIYKDRDLGSSMGRQGRLKVEQKYSLQVTAPLLRRIMSGVIKQQNIDSNVLCP